MKKIGLLCLALVLALGALGVGYAHWTDTVYINQAVETGTVAWEFAGFPGQADPGNDPNWFWDLEDIMGGILQDKDVASTIVAYEIGEHPHVLNVTIYNAYPYYYNHISYYVHYYGSIPGKIMEAVVKIDGEVVAVFDADTSPYAYLDFNDDGVPDMQMHWGNKPYFGLQLHYCDTYDHSFAILILQPAPQDATLEFTIEYTVVQWNLY